MSRVAPLLALLAASPAGAATFAELGRGLDRPGRVVSLEGGLRARGELLHNLDLDRGLTPAGLPLYPVPRSDPAAQLLTHADMRLRADLGLQAPMGGVAVRLRVDALDDLPFGSTPDGIASATTTARPPADAFVLRRAWGEALTPIGVLAAGRMGSHWGLGLLTNDGDCPDCDSGDAADRIAFVTPLVGHLWAVAYDVSAIGPTTGRRAGARVVDLDPADDVRGLTFAVMRWWSDAARRRRAQADKTTVEYGAYAAGRWQERDVPGQYLPTSQPVDMNEAPDMARGFAAWALDGWLRLTWPRLRLEAEAVVMLARVEQGSLIPGMLLRDPTTSAQVGGALVSEWGDPDEGLGAGLDLGFASGDPAPGFGAFPAVGATPPGPGELDGAQASPPRDTRVDNLRFHPDFRIDRILFRELIGAVTDAAYLRPHVRWRSASFGAGTLTVELAAVASVAVEAASTPSGARGMGIELDPGVRYESQDGFAVALDYGVLLPLSGFDNPAAGLDARPAQVLRARLGYAF